MADMLVKLYNLPYFENTLEFKKRTGITVRRAIAPEKHVVANWIDLRFGKSWVSECEVSFARNPITCLIAVENEKLLGFACYDSTMKCFFGPMGVDKEQRGRDIGKMLLMESLRMMRNDGYGYAIIGGAGPKEFYVKTAGAVIIPDSTPGIYDGMLRKS